MCCAPVECWVALPIGALYQSFVTDLKKWNVEDEGALSDLLGIDFYFSDNCVMLRQTKYIQKLVTTYLPNGVPNRVQKCAAFHLLISYFNNKNNTKLTSSRHLVHYSSTDLDEQGSSRSDWTDTC